MFDVDRIGRETFVRQIEVHKSLASTNDRGLAVAERSDVRLPMLIVTERQTAGRGRQSHRWWSAPGALTFSVVMNIGVPPERPYVQARLSLGCGLAVRETLRQLLPETSIGLKWPNDVLVDGRKACGVLLEAGSAAPERIVVGIGLNVNNSLAAAPPPLKTTAVSLVDAAGRPFDLDEVLIGLLKSLEAELQAADNDGLNLRDRWNRHCVLRGRRVRLIVGTREVSGVCNGIDENGALLVQTAYGIEAFCTGSVVEWV